MPDLENVIEGLECCIITPDFCRDDCPYIGKGDENDYCDEKLFKDVLALLKAQEPRVLDWNEIGTVDGAVWLEDRDKSEVVPGLVMQMYSAVNLDIKKDGKLHTASASRSDYGERWRCWTSRPTDAQREATPWP